MWRLRRTLWIRWTSGETLFLAARQALRFPREPGGFTYDELRVDEDFAAGHLLAFRVREQIFKNGLANLLAWNMHGGKGRGAKFRKLDVIESRHRNIVRHAHALITKFPQNTDGHEIIHAQDRRGMKT